jgi:hypothetical protein
MEEMEGPRTRRPMFSEPRVSVSVGDHVVLTEFTVSELKTWLGGLRPGGPVVEKGRQGVVLAVKEFGHSFAHVWWHGGEMRSWVRTESLAVVEKTPDALPRGPEELGRQ